MATLAQSRVQDDIHPLLRHPRPIAIDYTKAQRMLGWVVDDEEKACELQREKSFTTRWLERPLHSQADEKSHERTAAKQTDVHLDSTSCWEGGAVERTTCLPLRQPNQDRRPVINTDVSPITRRKPTLSTPRRRPISMQPSNPIIERRRLPSITAGESDEPFTHDDTWTSHPWLDTAKPRLARPASYQPQRFIPLEKPVANEPRPRPTSLAIYPRQRNRSGSKIASSRGLRSGSDANFSRPVSSGVTRPIPGEQLERDSVYQCLPGDRIGHTSPISPPYDSPCGDLGEDKEKNGQKSRNRWSAIPGTFKKLTWRRSSTATQETPDMAVKIEALRRVNYTEDNLQWYENSTRGAPNSRVSTQELLPTPVYSPFDVKDPFSESKLPLPFAPWADGPPSPAASVDKRRGGETSPLSPTRKPVPSGLSIDPAARVRPTSIHSNRSSLALVSPIDFAASLRHSIIDAPISPCVSTPLAGSRRGTPSLERTCLLCKTSKMPSDFIQGRVSSNCWHEPATCAECLRSWVYACFDTQGPDRCTCPECGETMTHDDVDAFADVSRFMRR